MKLLAILIALAPIAAWAGSVTGKLDLPPEQENRRIAIERYTGAISGKVAPPPARTAGVWLERPGLKAPASVPEIVFSQQGYQFEKSLLVIPLGTTVKFPNADPDFHNVYSLSRPKRFDLGRYKTGENPAPEVTFDRAGAITLRCEIHEHMRARILVVDSPYFTSTAPDGTFTISNVSAGEYTLHGQLDKKTSWKSTVIVPARGVVRISPPRS